MAYVIGTIIHWSLTSHLASDINAHYKKNYMYI